MGHRFTSVLALVCVAACGASAPRAEHGATDLIAVDAGTDAASPTRWANAELVSPEPAFAPPTPPMQREPWTRPDGLEPTLAAAIDALVARGFPDPRGCEYRSVRVRVGSLWNDGSAVEAPMFVIPGEPASAIGWDGIVRPALAIGDPADLGADVDRMFDTSVPVFCEGSDECVTAAPSLSATVLAARRGVGDAFDRRAAWEAAIFHDVSRPIAPESLEREHVGQLAEHAFYAYLRGADGEARWALARADAIAPLAADAPIVIEGDVIALRPAIRAELERRASEPAHLRLTSHDWELDLSDVPLDVLVASLDEVDERQGGQPGGVDLAADPIVHAIIAHGEDAIDPLLDVLDRSSALTRSAHFFRDFAPTRTLLSTYEAAYVAIANILDWSEYDAPCTGCDLTNAGERTRREVASTLRAYWTSVRALSPPERMMHVLLDDAAGLDAWAQAAIALVTPERLDERRYGSMPGIFPIECREGSDAMMGEPLRARADPSVTEVFARRLDGAVDGPRADQDADSRCAIAQALVAWDAEASVPALADVAHRYLEAHARIDCRAALLAFAADHGDLGLVDALASALEADPRDIGEDDLAVLLAHRDRAVVDAAVRHLLGASSGALAGLHLSGPPAHYDAPSRSLLGVPEIRAMLVAHLRDATERGWLLVADGQMEVHTHDGYSAGPAPEGAVEGRWRYSVADAWAAGLSSAYADCPRFSLADPRAQRRAQLAAVRAWLETTTFTDEPQPELLDPCDDER